jgi:hypothetical protein
MPPKRKSGAGVSATVPANGTNGAFHSDAELTPPPAVPIHPSESQIDTIVDEAVSTVLRKRRRTNPVSYTEKEAESDAEQDEQDLEDLAIEAEDVAQKAAAMAAAATPRKGRGGAKAARTPRKTAAQKRKEEEEEAYEDGEKSELSEEEQHEEVEEKATPKGRPGRKKATATATEGDPVTPAKRTPAKRSPKEASSSPLTDEDGEDETPQKGKGKKKTPKKPTPKKSRLAVDEPEFDEDGNEIVKKKRKPKVYPKIEYDIPDVERLETTFRGELPSFRLVKRPRRS